MNGSECECFKDGERDREEKGTEEYLKGVACQVYKWRRTATKQILPVTQCRYGKKRKGGKVSRVQGVRGGRWGGV